MTKSPQRRGEEPPLQVHPWSRGFSAGPRLGSLRRLDRSQRAHFDEHGFVLLEDLVDRATLEEVICELDPLERAVEADLRRREGGRQRIARAGTITFVYNPACRSPRLRRFASGLPFCDLAHDLLGPDVRLFWDQAVYKHTTEPRPFPCHQDNGYGFVSPESYLTCWLALTDADVRNGCPRVFPGLHRLGTLRHRWHEDGFALPLDWHDGTPVPMAAGSVLAFSSLLPHATGPNETDTVRKAYVLQYATEDAAYLRGDPDQGPPTHREPVRDLPATRQWPVLRGGLRVA